MATKKVQTKEYSVMAIISLVFGLLGVCVSCSGGIIGLIFSVPAIILGYLAVQETKDNKKDGKEAAMGGLVLGILSIVIVICFVLAAVGFLGLSFLSAPSYSN